MEFSKFYYKTIIKQQNMRKDSNDSQSTPPDDKKNASPQQQIYSQESIRRLQQQYIDEKLNRKKEERKRKIEQYGLSSSDEDDIPNSKDDLNVQEYKGELSDIDSCQNQQIMQKEINENKNRNNKKKIQILEIYDSIKATFLKCQWRFQNDYLIINQHSVNIKEIITLIYGIQSKCQNQLKLQMKNQEIILRPGQTTDNGIDVPVTMKICSNIIASRFKSICNKKQEKVLSPVKKPSMQVIQKKYIYCGWLYKKSQYLGRWSNRLVAISNKSIYSYKAAQQAPTMTINWEEIKSMQTKFDVFENGIITVLKYGSTQTAFSLPLVEFKQGQVDNWMRKLCLKNPEK